MTIPKTQGECPYCKKTFAGRGISRHLKTCKLRQEAIAQQKPKSTIYHLRIQATYIPIYWLHIEIDGRQTLEALDQFLRDIWLECCGHLSEFRINHASYRVFYPDDFYGDGLSKTKPKAIIEEPVPPITHDQLLQKASPLLGKSIDEIREMETNNPYIGNYLKRLSYGEFYMNFMLKAVLSEGLEFEHIYDFGSSTELTLKVIEIRQGDLGKSPIVILARNNPPPYVCDKCGAPATQITDYFWENDEFHFCDVCAEKLDPAGDYMMRLVNSPRAGVCGYE